MSKIGLKLMDVKVKQNDNKCQFEDMLGVRLASDDSKVYLKVKMFNSYGITSKLKPKFPLIFYEQFCFVNRFNCDTVPQLLKLLSDETVVICLISENGLIIAKYECCANQFLFPKPHLRPKYSKSSRCLLMDCCLLPIAPKLEFTIINSLTQNELSDTEPGSQLDSTSSDS